jgi:hypothetical protein
VLGFRAAARKLAQSGLDSHPTSPISIFSKPRRRDQIEKYLENYRRAPSTVTAERTLRLLVGSDSKQRVESSAPARLSA